MIGNSLIGEKSIGDTREIPFIVLAIRTIKWAINNSVSKTSTLLWSIFNIVSGLKTLRWNINNFISSIKTISWEVYQYVLKNSSCYGNL
jgi:hypothetical protein